MKHLIKGFLLLAALSTAVTATAQKAVVLEVNTTTLWGIVKFSKDVYKEMDIRTLNPAHMRFSIKARRALIKSSRLIRRIEKRYNKR